MIAHDIRHIDPARRSGLPALAETKICQTTKRTSRQSGFPKKVTVTFLSYDL